MYTFTYQKILLNTLFCLFLKSSKPLNPMIQVIFRERKKKIVDMIRHKEAIYKDNKNFKKYIYRK